jgi:hypothetical protein
VRLEWLGQLKNTITSSEIELATLQCPPSKRLRTVEQLRRSVMVDEMLKQQQQMDPVHKHKTALA